MMFDALLRRFLWLCLIGGIVSVVAILWALIAVAFGGS